MSSTLKIHFITTAKEDLHADHTTVVQQISTWSSPYCSSTLAFGKWILVEASCRVRTVVVESPEVFLGEFLGDVIASSDGWGALWICTLTIWKQAKLCFRCNCQKYGCGAFCIHALTTWKQAKQCLMSWDVFIHSQQETLL